MKVPDWRRLPIFRSDSQASILFDLFVRDAGPSSLTDLASRTGTPIGAVHREVERLEAAGIVESIRQGRNRLVSLNRESPYVEALGTLVTRAFGVPELIRQAVTDVDGLERALIFGSWARGEGAANDIDLLVVGNLDVGALYARLRPVERLVGTPINTTVLSPSEWDDGESGFLTAVRSSPTVDVL
ncbi:MAG TPA: helix-turn-helix domain-containing protein [Acidimicrobiia bacterium]|nr:helix-turn-helix domain-containing protein [Acidimicrobiia bacterium]